MRIAVIDMGTNTFNLLVAESNHQSSYNILHESKMPVKLGEGGITQKTITPAAWERGLNAIERHVSTAASYGVDKVYAFATSATRDASNGKEFTEAIRSRFGLKVETIDGDREATLIYKGVRQALDLGSAVNLILDIGGGSNELVLANRDSIFWLKSFNLGISRIMQTFTVSDPVAGREIDLMEDHFRKELQPLFEAAAKYKPVRLVGSSGSFDSYRDILTFAGVIPHTVNPWAEIPVAEYLKLHDRLIVSTHAERAAIKGLESIRVDLIVVASLFTHFVLRELRIGSMYQSSYALKEGFFAELIGNKPSGMEPTRKTDGRKFV